MNAKKRISSPIFPSIPGSAKKKRTSLALTVLICSVLLLFFFFFTPQGWGGVPGARLIFCSILFSPEMILSTLFGNLPVPNEADIRFRVILGKWIAILAAYGTGMMLLRTTRTQYVFTREERLFFALFSGFTLWIFLLGLGAVIGKNGFFMFGSFFGLRLCSFIAMLGGLGELWLEIRSIARSRKKGRLPGKNGFGRFLSGSGLVFLVLFVLLYTFGSLIPTSEYDMLEYHLQGPREIWESGQLSFSPHNVYLNMPLGTEMLYFWGGLFLGEGYDRILIGKELVAFLAPLTALGLFAFSRHFFRSTGAGLLAALVYLAFIGNYQIFSIGLNDGALGLYLFGSLYAYLLYRKTKFSVLLLFCALGSGTAIAIKYTGVVFVLLPILLILIVEKGRERLRKAINTRRFFREIAIFLGISVLIGGIWYLKNFEATGNPVYPLCWNFFGDSTGNWTEAINTRWIAAHSSDLKIGSFCKRLADFLLRDDPEYFASPFTIILIPLFAGSLILWKKKKKEERFLFLFLTVYTILFVVLWGFGTHRLLRFLLPVVPLLVLLFVLGYQWIFEPEKNRKIFITFFLLIGISLIYSFMVSFAHQRDYLAPTSAVRNDPERFTDWAVWFNRQKDPGGKLLLIGEAQAFRYQVPLIYSTCWNHSPLMKIVKSGDTSRIKKKFAEDQIKWILVNESELERFRSPGNYGFTDSEIGPDLFRFLEQKGIIQRFYPKEFDQFLPYSKEKIKIYKIVISD
ncbi:MAG: hypothetical protein Q4G69_07485 [Planctomycetia bacterium]|nr:hypothetical protein [Planctomycetia bacterium]